MSKLHIAILVSIAIAGIYSIGSYAGTREARVVVPEATTGEGASMGAAAKKLAAAHRIARAKCEILVGAERGNCRTDARAQVKRALRSEQALGPR